MDDILSAAKADYAAKQRALHSVEVPEWGLVVYWGPLTLAENERILSAYDKSTAAGAAETLVVRARDANGERIFPGVERDTLMTKVDAAVVARIVTAMRLAEAPSVDDQKKD